MALKRLPKGIQSFGELRKNNYVYVDKTEHIYNLISHGKYYFLSRPRRFGKSLLLSTFSHIFKADKELFEGLWINSSDYDWKQHPVIHLSFASMSHSSTTALSNDIAWTLEKIAQEHSIQLDAAPSIQSKLITLVQTLAQKNKVVVLIDEYDYALISNMKDRELARACSDVMRDFFTSLKDLDEYVRFVFITGVSKFSKTSIFSGLNNLEDITISLIGATLLGYTHEELSASFSDYLSVVAQRQKISVHALSNEIQKWYDGYQFDIIDTTKVYNPYSVLLFLNSGRFHNYWFETGTPSFLMHLIKTEDYPIIKLDSIEATYEELISNELDDIAITPLLFQTGYLTLEGVAPSGNYTLQLPNYEVKSSFYSHLLKRFTKLSFSELNEFSLRFIKALKVQDVDIFCRLLQTFFAEIPSTIQISLERYYQTIIYIFARFIGLAVEVEVATNIGRIDMVIQLPDYTYIFEFKINSNAQKALDQIEEKLYYQKYMLNNKNIIVVGINFDIKKRNIEDWLIKKIK